MFSFIAHKINCFIMRREVEGLVAQAALVEKAIAAYHGAQEYLQTLQMLQKDGVEIAVSAAAIEAFEHTLASRKEQLVFTIKTMSTKVDILTDLKAKLETA